MDNVFGQIVVTTSDEDLGTGDFVCAISLWLGLGTDHTQVSTRVALCQTHGAGPLTGVHVRQVFFLQLIGCMVVDGQCRARRQGQVEAHRDVGGVQHFLEQQYQHLGHVLAAVIRLTRQTTPAALGQLFERFRIPFGCGDNTVVPLHTLFMARLAQRGDQVFIDLGTFFKDRIRQLAVNFLGSRHVLPKLLGLKYLVQDKLHITQRRFIFGHI